MKSKNKNKIIVIQGPTASGKSLFAVELSNYLDIEIISSDSRQFYREMNIGTAKPGPELLEKVPHHFISFLSIHDSYNASSFEKDALAKIHELFGKNKIPVVTGGSGLYTSAIIYGFNKIPDVPPEIRQQIIKEYQESGLEKLVKELEEVDPETYQTIDLNNFRRVLRAIEVYRASGKPISYFKKSKKSPRNFEVINIALYYDLPELYQRINQRCDEMLHMGLLDEVKELYPVKHLQALQTIGYKEFFDFLDGLYIWEEAVEKFKQHSRNYARKQISWLKRDKSVKWFKGFEKKEALQYILSHVT